MPRRPWRPSRRRSSIRSPRVPICADNTLVQDAATWPLDECLVRDDQGAITVVWIRRHPDQPRYVGAVIRADLSGGGIATVDALLDVGRAARWSAVESVDRAQMRRDPALAVQLLNEALALAGTPDPDWSWLSALVADGRSDRSFAPRVEAC